MPTIIPRAYYCPKCKKEIKKKQCDCGSRTKPLPPYTVRFRWIGENGIPEHKRIKGDPVPWDTQTAAQRGYEKWIAEHAPNVKLETRTTDFLSLYEEYKGYLRTTVKESSYVSMTYRMEKYILPEFEKTKVTDITSPVIIDWQRRLNEKDYSQKFKIEIRSSFIHFFKFLQIYKFENPFAGIRGFSKSKEIKKEIQFWTESEFEQFIKVVQDEKFRVMFSFLYLTGCRKGETCALQWSDVDFVNHTVKIRATIAKVLKGGNNALKSSPKSTNSYRTILLPQKLTASLKALKGDAAPDFYVFGKEYTPMPFNTLEHAFKRYIAKAGVKPIRIHDLRHSHASLLINKGESQLATIYTIAARLGDTVDMIFKIYGHLFPTTQREIIDKLDVNF